MSRPQHVPRPRRDQWIYLVVYGIAFGYVEAAVVYYLRQLITYRFNGSLHHYRVLFNLGFITFVRPAHQLLISTRIADAEVARETATIVMLAAVALIAARRPLARLGAFLVGFSAWDLSYYLWLRILIHWPQNFFTKDVFFLIPVAWIGPVLTPIIISSALFAVGSWLYLRDSPAERARTLVANSQ